MSDRATTWSLTINNPTEADEEDIARARQKGWKVDGQLEKGENGTPHYQLILKTPQVRFSAVKKAFPRAHIQIARNPAALNAYVHKADTRVSALPSASDRYPSLSKFWHLIYDICNEWNWLDNFYEARWWRQAFDDLEISRSTFERYSDFEGHMDTRECRIVNEMIAALTFERCVARLIYKGYHVEHFYSPPNISVFKKFHFAILRRCRDEMEAQTDRQTDNALDLQEIVVPVIENNDQEGISQEENESPPSSPRSSSPDQPTPPSHP